MGKNAHATSHATPYWSDFMHRHRGLKTRLTFGIVLAASLVMPNLLAAPANAAPNALTVKPRVPFSANAPRITDNFPLRPASPQGLSTWHSGARAALGDATHVGDMANQRLNGSIVSMATNPKGSGYWLLGSDGGVFSFGDAPFFGSTGSIRLNKPILAMSPHPNGQGYWFVGSDGGVFTYGDAQFHGSTGSMQLNKPIVGMAATPDGNGYWLVASDGGIFSFGSAAFYGSTGSLQLNKPIVGMASTSDGHGYWLVASDGGLFAFGNAGFYGSTGSMSLNSPIVGMSSTVAGNGYWLAAADGGVFAFGDAPYCGSGGAHGNVVAMSRTATGAGYRFASDTGSVIASHYPTVHRPRPGETVTNGSNYRFESISNGQPLRWDPCRGAIPVVVSTRNLPVFGMNSINDALREIAAVTGLRFEIVGTDDHLVTGNDYLPETLAIGWVKWGESPYITDGVVGMARWATSGSGRYFRVSGATVTLLVQVDFEDPTGEYYMRAYYKSILMHEIGHTLGLGHVDDANEIMNPTYGGFSDFGPGDLQGLTHLGTALGCVR